jgi:hypothetical protein
MDVYVENMPTKPQAESWLCPNHKVGYFRDCYNGYSLANWLSQNVDEKARGEWGLEIFDQKRPGFNTAAWRKELLSKSLKWFMRSVQLRGQETYVGYPGKERIKVPAEKTDDYIEWLEELLRFAELVNQRKAKVVVWG